MRIFEKIIESLDVKIVRAFMLEAIHPFIFDGSINERNVLVQLNNGEMYDEKGNKFKPGSFLFVPQARHFSLKVGKGTQAPNILDEIVYNETVRKQYLEEISAVKYKVTKKDIVSVISFELTLYNAFPFFPLLEMPAFPIIENETIARLVRNLCVENEASNLGRETILTSYAKELVIMLCRYIDEHPDLHHHIDRLNYLTDKRLVDIVNYINANLGSDLSNKTIASIAFVSEDYVGQFFKTLTNRNLQDYIEEQRLAKALQMLKSNPQSVQEISHRVGFKDPAYFSRRFKMKFGINANAVKQGKTTII